MKQTAVEWLVEQISYTTTRSEIISYHKDISKLVEQAIEMEKNNTDNKVIHFAEWLTKKHTSTLITLYEHFEEEYYTETFKSE